MSFRRGSAETGGPRPACMDGLRRMIRLSAEPWVVADGEGSPLDLNPPALALLGLDGGCETPLGRTIIRELWNAARCAGREEPDGSWTGEAFLPVVRPDGVRVDLRVRGSGLPADDGDPSTRCTALLLRHFSGASSSAGDADELGARLDAFVSISPDVLFILSPRLQVLYMNPAGRTVLGVDPSSLFGTVPDIKRFLPSEEIRRIRVLNAYGLARQGLRGKLFKIYRQGGEPFWGLLTLVPVRTRRKLRYWVGLIRDVNEFYKTREQLVLQHNQLRKTIAQLEEAGRMQEQFVANVTHELRTPLTTILIATEVLKKETDAGSAEPRPRQVEMILKNARGLLSIINDLLDLAKLKGGGFIPRPASLELEPFIAGLLEEMAPLFEQKGLSLDLRISPSAPRALNTDRELLARILRNILSNACKFTEAGGVSLGVDLEGNDVRIRVADTGIGIPPGEIKAIFEEFRQVDGSDARHHPGTGLGLAIAARLTRLLGGRITAQSEFGKGSTFTLTLPSGGP